MKKSLIALLISSALLLSACDEKMNEKLLDAEKKIVQLETQLNRAKATLKEKEEALEKAKQGDTIFPALQVEIVKLCDKQKTIKLPKDPNDEFAREEVQLKEFISTAKTGVSWLDELLLSLLKSNKETEQNTSNKAVNEADIIAQCETDFIENEKIAREDQPIAIEHAQATYYIGQRNNIVTFQQYEYSYTGGAHGQGSSTYLNIDINKKAVIRLNDLIPTHNQEKVKELLWQSYANDRMDENGKYAGYANKNDFYIPETFYFSPDGIKFIYPVYAVGPYAEGEVEVFLNYYTLKGLLNDAYFPTEKDGFELNPNDQE